MQLAILFLFKRKQIRCWECWECGISLTIMQIDTFNRVVRMGNLVGLHPLNAPFAIYRRGGIDFHLCLSNRSSIGHIRTPKLHGIYLSRHKTKPTKWFVCLAKAQINLGICLVWSESSMSVATQWMHSEDWSDWADLSLRWVHGPFCLFYHACGLFMKLHK